MKEANGYAKRLLSQVSGRGRRAYCARHRKLHYRLTGRCFRFALRFDGIHGDKKVGMEEVARSAENGRYLRPFAKIILALAARREKQDVLAEKLLRGLSEQYPDNALFASECAKATGLLAPVITGFAANRRLPFGETVVPAATH